MRDHHRHELNVACVYGLRALSARAPATAALSLRARVAGTRRSPAAATRWRRPTIATAARAAVRRGGGMVVSFRSLLGRAGRAIQFSWNQPVLPELCEGGAQPARSGITLHLARTPRLVPPPTRPGPLSTASTPATSAPETAPLPSAPPVASRYDRSIVEGPLRPVVWKLAWPTMLTNMIGGLQGIVDHALVGHLVGYTGNAAIGVALQIFIIVIVFINSLFTGMSVLVARFAGAGEEDKVDRTVYQAFLTAVGLSLLVMAPLGYIFAQSLLDLVNATPAVKAEALPFLRIMFLFSSGMLVFYMLSGALRAAGDARTRWSLASS